MPNLNLPRVAALCLLAVAVAAAACTSASSQHATPTLAPTFTPAPPTASAISVTPTPDPAVLEQDGGIAIIRLAYDRLLDEYIRPIGDSGLLSAAWSAAATKAGGQGARVPARPAFTGDREGDFRAFSAAYVPMTAGIADANSVRYAAITAMANTLDDCHTFFLQPVLADTVVQQREGKGSVGIGVDIEGVPPLIVDVIVGSPAARAGVEIGDRIASINGHDATHFGAAEAFSLINGDEGTSVSLQVRHADGALADLTMDRERVVPPNVESRVIPGTDIGYVRVREFLDGGIATDLRTALTGFDAQGVTKWIIDIRDNPGGRMDVDAFSLFVKDGVVVRDSGRDGKVEELRASGDTLPVVRPTVLLVNHRTGSVAEMFAATLQEYHAAYVMGETTDGCVGYTDVGALGDGSSLAVTTDVNTGPVTNKPLNGVGVIPDQAVGRSDADIAAGRDPQLDAAVTHLRAVAP